MIRKIVRQLLLAQTLSTLTVSVCLIVDNIMIGNYLGVDAIAAYGLANPILLVIGAVSSMLTNGVQVVCSRSLGMGSQKETDKGYSSALMLSTWVSLMLLALILVFRNPLTAALGAGSSEVLYNDTRNYLVGFGLGMPATIIGMILIPFLQMAGKTTLLIISVLAMTVGDIAFDFLNVCVFHGGMLGMGLASSLSYYLGIGILLFYFCSKKCTFHFSRSLVSSQKIREILWGGIPCAVSLASNVAFVLCVNYLLMYIGGSNAVAAFSVVCTAKYAFNCISTGSGGVALTLSGIFYHEGDHAGLREVLELLFRAACFLGLGICALMLLFAPQCVRLFIPESGSAQTMAVTGVRLYALGPLFCCIRNALQNTYQSLERIRLTNVISVCSSFFLPVLCALAFSCVLGINGVWMNFILGELLCLLGIALYLHLRGPFEKTTVDPGLSPSTLLSRLAEFFLSLPASFDVPPEDRMEFQIHTIEEAVTASSQAESFCLARGMTSKGSYHVAVCIEEMATNTVKYGFSKQANRHLLVRLQYRDGKWVLRFRDDCHAFDPVSYVPKEGRADGIRLLLALADEVRYTYSLNLNNLTLIFKETLPDRESV